MRSSRLNLLIKEEKLQKFFEQSSSVSLEQAPPLTKLLIMLKQSTIKKRIRNITTRYLMNVKKNATLDVSLKKFCIEDDYSADDSFKMVV